MNGFRYDTDAYHDYAVAQWETARDELGNLARCKANWDGEGALPARPGVIAATLRLFQILDQFNSAPTDVYLAPDGTVILEWHVDHGSTIIVNVRTTDHAEVTYRFAGQAPQFGTVPIPTGPGKPSIPAAGPNEPISYLDDGAYELAA